jgi:hypothetical protein
MFDNTLHIPLRFYSALSKQDRFKPYATTKRFTQFTDTTHLPPFQIKVPKGSSSATINLVNLATGSSTISPTVYYEEFATFSYLIHDRTSTVSIGAGDCYLDITCGSDHLFSEVFTVGDITGKTVLTYYSTNDVAGVDYTNTGHNQYQNTFIFDCTLAKPEYVIEEEAVENGDGDQILTFQRSVKLFKFWFYAPEYIADALALICLHDTVTLTTHYGEADSESGTIYDFAMSAEWQETKGLAKITCEFRDSSIIKTTCANNIV